MRHSAGCVTSCLVVLLALGRGQAAVAEFVPGPGYGAVPSPAKSEGGKKDAAGKSAHKPEQSKEKAAPAKAEAKKEAPAKKEESKKGDAKKEEPKKEESKKGDKESKPATYKVKKRLLKIEVALDGLFEAKNTAEISFHAQEWNEFEVLKAVPHGTQVKAGDLLVSLDPEKIDKALADLQRELTLSRLALQEAELHLQALETSVPLDLALGQRGKRIADEDMDYFLKVDRPLSERIANFMVKLSEDYLAYEKEELRQLEKMYKADDLVEETEEIILKRARDSVERAKFTVERTQAERNSILKMTIPRAEELLKFATQRQALELTKSKVTLPLSQRKQSLALERMKIELGRSEERLKKLMADRTIMTIKAPLAGVVYYGRCLRGKWSSSEMVAEKLRRGSRLASDDIFMTVVEARPLGVRASLPEKQLQYVVPGLKGIVQPTAFPDVRLTAIVERVSPVPLSTSSSREFDTALSVSLEDAPGALMPGMTCDVKLLAYRKPDALTVPSSALTTEDFDGRKSYVYFPGKDGKPTKREVTVGRRGEKQVEILKGLAEGDEILEEAPKEKD